MNEYRFPAVVLEGDLEPAAIARIFERVNRTGLRLNTFDLMVAKTWFWHCSFSGAFDAAANTRLVAHYRALMRGEVAPLRSAGISINFQLSSKRTDRSLWAGVACYLATLIHSEIENHPRKYEFADFEVETFFSRYEVQETQENKVGFRSVLNALIVPSAFATIARRISAEETLDFAAKHEFIDIVNSQVNGQKTDVLDWQTFASSRESDLRAGCRERLSSQRFSKIQR